MADNSRSSSNHQHLEGVKYTDAYRRLIKSHKENSNKIKVKSGRHVHISNIEENTTEMEFDSSADTNQNTISVSSELAKIQNKIKAEIDFTEDLKYSSKSDKEAQLENFNRHFDSKVISKSDLPMQIQASSCVTNSNYDTVKNVEIQDVCGNKGESFKYDSIKILSPSLLRNTAEFGCFNSNISPAKTEISNNEKSREYSKDNLQKLFEDFQNSIIDIRGLLIEL